MTPKMFTRRNWLLRCSILINVAVILYICSHVMIGGGGNFATGPGFIIQESNSNNNNNNLNSNNRILSPSALTSGGGAGGGGIANVPPSVPVTIKSKDDLAKVKEVELKPDDGQNQHQETQNAAAGNDNAKDDNPNQNANVNPEPQCDDGACAPIIVDDAQQKAAKDQPSKADEKQSIDLSETPTDMGGGGVVPPESVTFVNNSNPDGYMATGDEKEFDERLRSVLKCHDRLYAPETLQRGDFWVLKNYIRADHGELKCHETVTYTTHADFTFLDNLIPLLERWIAPISIALHAPGTDFTPTLNAIKYLRDCLPESVLVRQYVTFHIYFSTKHIPKFIPKYDVVLNTPYNCSRPAPYSNFTTSQLYKTQKKLLYPVNVGRNVARDSALSHFILASDIELYPNPGLVKKFLEMIARNEAYLHRKAPRVFPLSIFEVEHSAPVPKDKTELQELLRTAKAIPFHKRVCSSCHGVPKSKEWMAANETEELSVFHIGKRVGYFIHWEPIYIGTHADPHYDERLSWEGKSDKMTQGYTLCVLDYEFHILDNAFLVHKPGIKVLKKDPRRAMLAAKTNQLIKKIIYPELKIMYGTRKGCAV